MDGDEFEYQLSSNERDTRFYGYADVPFSCKGGVCCTCKLK